MERVIKIIDSNTTTQRLILSYDGDDIGNKKDGENVMAHALDRIVWELVDTKVYSYRIEPKARSENIWHFWNHPPKHNTRSRRETGGVGFFAAGKKYYYTIVWQAVEGGPEYRHDPIITIKPHALFGLLSAYLPGLVGLSTLIKWRMERMRKNKP